MSYTPHEWQNDELITAAKLNNIEEGIAAGGSGGGWDAVIRLTHANTSGPDDPVNLTPSIVSGTYADLYNKLSNGGCPTILVEYVHSLYLVRYAVPMAYVTYFTNEAIFIRMAGFTTIENIFKLWGYLLWTSSDFLEWE